MPGWDNTPRRPDGGVLAVVGNDPELYAWWLSNAVDRARTVDPENPLVFVNAWNEWAEGCHLEPDERFGRAFLEATSNVVGGPGRPVHESRDARPPTFAELYFDLYEEFMEVQHTHTEFLATFGRRLDAAVRDANQELERSRDANAALGRAGGASAPRHERCPPVGPGPSLIWGVRRRDARRRRAGRVSRARLLPAHPQDRGRDRDHVPRRGLPVTSRSVPRPTGTTCSRCRSRALPRLRLFRGHFGAMLPGLLPRPPRVVTTLRDPVERALSEWQYVLRHADHPYYAEAHRQGPSLTAWVHDTTAEPTSPPSGRRAPRCRPGRRAAPEPLAGPVRRAGVAGSRGVPATGRDVRSRAARPGDGISHRLCRGRLRRSTRRLRRAGRVRGSAGRPRNRSDCATRHQPANRATSSPDAEREAVLERDAVDVRLVDRARREFGECVGRQTTRCRHGRRGAPTWRPPADDSRVSSCSISSTRYRGGAGSR